MRTEPPSPLASWTARLRASAGKARRWLASQGAGTRVGLLVVLLAALVAAGYFATIETPSEVNNLAWLLDGHKISNDDLVAISDALEAEGISHVTDKATGRVGVKPTQKAEALAAINKHKAMPRTLAELSQEEPASWLDQSEDRQRREVATRERRLKYQIEGLESTILSADVDILRTRTRAGLNAPWNVGVYVYLETDSGRELSHRVIEGIETFLKGSIPDLNPRQITVVDQTGRRYLDPSNPALKEQLKTHAREETWREKIAESLRHIPNVAVDVLLETELPPPPPSPAVTSEEVAVPNGKLLIEPDPAVVKLPPLPQTPRTRANVLIRVPRSFYLSDFHSRNPSRTPTQDDLDRMREKNDRLIHDVVGIHIPKDELGQIKIAVIQDDLTSVPRPLLIPSSVEPQPPWVWMALSGGVIVASIGAVGAMVRLATRRQPSRPSRTAMPAGYVAHGPESNLPGPSERVRELIRQNPEAAAGVLQRWIGQGGALP